MIKHRDAASAIIDTKRTGEPFKEANQRWLQIPAQSQKQHHFQQHGEGCQSDSKVWDRVSPPNLSLPSRDTTFYGLFPPNVAEAKNSCFYKVIEGALIGMQKFLCCALAHRSN